VSEKYETLFKKSFYYQGGDHDFKQIIILR